jgi:hypothetical protein
MALLRAASLCPLLVVVLGLSTSASGKSGDDPSAAPDAEVTAPVEIDGNVLFRLPGISSLPAPERAARVASNIAAITDDPKAGPRTCGWSRPGNT